MNRIFSGLSVLVSIALPFFLLTTAIRVMITPLFAQIEYHTPAFPDDPYGFTLQDRLKWSRYAIDYLVNSAGIEYLGDLKFPDGQPLYNERELSHMVDVKNLVQFMIRAWWILLLLLAGLGLWAWQSGWLASFWLGISRGGWATLGLIAALLLGVAISFEGLFTEFHRLFFTGDTWIFYWSDTLIRLFPMRFWRDAFILVGAVVIIGALLCIKFGNQLARRTL